MEHLRTNQKKMRYEKLYNKFTLWANQNIVIKLLVATIIST
jgi:hypothetical protein